MKRLQEFTQPLDYYFLLLICVGTKYTARNDPERFRGQCEHVTLRRKRTGIH